MICISSVWKNAAGQQSIATRSPGATAYRFRSIRTTAPGCAKLAVSVLAGLQSGFDGSAQIYPSVIGRVRPRTVDRSRFAKGRSREMIRPPERQPRQVTRCLLCDPHVRRRAIRVVDPCGNAAVTRFLLFFGKWSLRIPRLLGGRQ